MIRIGFLIAMSLLFFFGCDEDADEQNQQETTIEDIEQKIQTVCELFSDCIGDEIFDACVKELDEFVGCVTTDECLTLADDYLKCAKEKGECVDDDYVIDECDDFEEPLEECCD